MGPAASRRPGARAARRGTLARRLVIGHVITLLAVLVVVGVVLDRTLQATLVDDLTQSLRRHALAVRTALDDASLQRAAERLGHDLGIRITVILADGTVVADSDEDPTRMENHRTRPEVSAALAGGTGVATRRSSTVGQPFRYLALPAEDGRVVRVALPLSEVARTTGRMRSILAAGLALGAVLGSAGVWVAARRMTRPLRDMAEVAAALAAGRLSARAPEHGVSELRTLAATLNRMAADLGTTIEDARRERRTRDLILATMAEGVVLVEPRGAVRYANDAASHLLAGRSHTDPAALRLPPSLESLAVAATESAQLVEEELPLEDARATVRVSALPVGADGLTLLVVRDVTESRRVETMRRDFVAAASHELKTPVASIRAAAETLPLALEDDPDSARRFADQLVREAARLSRIVMDLLDLSRLESERPVTEPIRLDTVAALEADAHAERAAEAGVALEQELAPATIEGSRRDVALLVSNLLDNAIRYTPPEGTVRITVSGSGGVATLAVADTGIGIPSRDLPRIFERFYRVDRARSRETGGTGLGLAIVKHVAEQHGASIDARSELGRGSVFTVAFPVARATDVAGTG